MLVEFCKKVVFNWQYLLKSTSYNIVKNIQLYNLL